MRKCFLALVVTAACWAHFEHAPMAVAGDKVVLENGFVRRVIPKDADVWRTVGLARGDGTGEVKMHSEEFLIRLMDGRELTVANYKAAGESVLRKTDKLQRLRIDYVAKKGTFYFSVAFGGRAGSIGSCQEQPERRRAEFAITS